MTRSATIWLGTGVVLLLSALLVWFLPGWLGLTGSTAWILRGGLWLLLLVAAVLTLKLLLPGSAEAELRGDDPLVEAFRAARTRLSSLVKGTGKGGSSFDALPVTLVVGPRHATKTTLLANSGLDPELLAGEVYRGDQVAPTEVVNLWYAGETVWVEAGGPLLDDPVRWEKLGRLLSPRRLGAVLGRGGQPPRQAVVCFSCDAFQMSGAAEAIPAAARALRDRLADLSEQLGIRLPVYVVFTKADRIPHFPEFVATLTRDEVRDFLGATFPVTARSDAGTHAEREGSRIATAFDGLVRRLATKRLTVLPRDPAAAGSAYEFPRELRKISGLATSFMVELCRPGQRPVGPFLRGFYFAGVRPVVVESAAAAPAAAAPSGGGGMDATRVFKLQDLQAFQKPAEAPRGQARRVPQWLFHERVFRDVVLSDQVARAVTGGGARVNLLRRASLATVAVASLVLLALFTLSFLGNRGLQGDARAALAGVQGIESAGGDLPGLEDLQRMEELRQVGARLREYETDGPPLRLRMGLYRGDEVLDAVRRGYFGALDRMALARVHGVLSGRLTALPDEPDPTSDYGTTYSDLKAYLITTDHPDRSTPEFLTPVLLERWVGGPGEGLDEEWLRLARLQMDFYATELVVEDPYDRTADGSTVERARGFLNQFAGADRFYQALVTDAEARNPSIRFAAVFPGSESVVANPYEVSGAYTEGGWASVQESLADIDRLLAGETWVVGEQALSAAERAGLAEEIRNRYVTTYRDQWRQYLQAARVQPLGSPQDAAEKLQRLSGIQSPVLQVLALAARNTAVDSSMAAAFQPVHQVTPPEVRDRFVSESNQMYAQALGTLAQVMGRLSGSTPDPGAAAQGQAAVADAQGVVQSMGNAFAISPEAQGVAGRVNDLLEEPIRMAGRLIEAGPTRELNAGGAGFCSQMQPILRKYPFNPSGEEATPEDVLAGFEPGASILWSFYQGPVAEVLTRQGTRYGPRPGSGTNLNPAFVDFFNRGVAVTRAFFGNEAGATREPSLQMQIRLETSEVLEEIQLIVDGRTLTFTRVQQGSQPVAWTPRSSRLEVTGLVNGNRVPLVEVPQGTWAIFRFLQQAEWRSEGGNRYALTWPPGDAGVRLTGTLTLGTGVEPIMQPGFFQGFQCVSQVAR